MTRDDITRMALEAASVYSDTTDFFALSPNQLERFATRVAAQEREACAKVCDEAHELRNSSFQGAAAAIRARSQQ